MNLLKKIVKRMDVDLKLLGKFKVSSGALIVSDPCYKRGIWCQQEVENVKNGTWNFYIYNCSDSSVTKIIAIHAESEEKDVTVYEREIRGMGSDSGQIGIFDAHMYRNDSQFSEGYIPVNDFAKGEDGRLFYGACCDQTLSESGAGVILYGGVSQSEECENYGIIYSQGANVIAVEIFI